MKKTFCDCCGREIRPGDRFVTNAPAGRLTLTPSTAPRTFTVVVTVPALPADYDVCTSCVMRAAREGVDSYFTTPESQRPA